MVTHCHHMASSEQTIGTMIFTLYHQCICVDEEGQESYLHTQNTAQNWSVPGRAHRANCFVTMLGHRVGLADGRDLKRNYPQDQMVLSSSLSFTT